MQLKSILCALHPLIFATSILRSMQPLTSTLPRSLYVTSVLGSTTHTHIRTTPCAVSILETHTYAAPTLGVHIHASTYTYSSSTQKMFHSYTGSEHLKIFVSIMSFSTYPIKL